MILNFHGGARPKERTLYGKQKIKYISSCSAVCLDASKNASVKAAAGQRVARGSLLGENDGTPVYSSIAGQFRGIAEIEGNKYFVVIANGESCEERIFSPETRSLTELSHSDIIESAKNFAIYDSRSGKPLWKMLESAEKCRRIVIDCTESAPESAINYRLCIEKAKSLVGGAKILIRAMDALKCVFTIEHYRNASFEELGKYATDEKLFAAAEMDEKYPYLDSVIMDALYLKALSPDETALDHGIFIVGAEAAIALYDAMVSGMPQLDRYIGLCTGSTANGGSFCVPRGITMHDLTELAEVDGDKMLVENSLLSGGLMGGAITDKTRAVIAATPQKTPRAECISCGKCISACPARLFPNDILSEKNSRRLRKLCVACGACRYVCPSGIPLSDLINKNIYSEEVQS